MNDQEFERSLKELKKEYDQLLNQSSPEEIMNYIKRKEKRKTQPFKRLQGLGIAASIVAVIGIGSILLLSENKEHAVPDVDTVDLRGAETFHAEEGETSAKLVIDRDDQIVDTLMIEGQEEEIDLKLWVDEELRFSTYIDERFEVDTISDEKGYTARVFANYTGDRVEPPFFTVHLAATDYQVQIEQYIQRIREDYAQQGFIENNEDYRTTWSSSAAFLFFHPESDMAIAVNLFEVSGTIYEVTETFFGEFSEGFGGRLELMQHHFQWHE
ncbi:hypothetical protein [Alkalihalobacterium alkalinitrilicum]|uniref:hypothetical protein n=1 Tax=Alkalihalobacterium alkalinitrilicum TaxID=427920 RepID=UPI000995AFB7|nr:hypothetical protein [Alkalihalobacterium alkalinitrilicum]